MSGELPPGWASTTIYAVSEVVSKRGPNPSRSTFLYIDLGAIDNKAKEISAPTEVAVSAAPSRAKQIVKQGDIVFSNVRVYLENIALVPKELEGEVASTAFCVLRPKQGIDARYVFHYVTSAPFIRAVSELQRGNSPPSVQDGDVKAQLIPVAPENEQKRIVSKIDELFSRIDEGERALERVQKLVERYRQSVLKAAVTGELTREWREKHKDTLESGEALLARILTARREAWEQAELTKMQAKGIKPKDDNWKKKYKDPVPPETTDLPELPDGWVWASIEMLASPQSYALKAGPFGSALKKSDYSNGGYKVYGQEQVIAGDWSIGDYYIGKDKFRELESCAVETHDVLISLVGTIGKVLVLPEECEPGIINPRLIKVSLNREFYLPEFFKVYFESSFLKSLYRLEAHGATMDVLNLGIIKRLPFPLCCLDEQEQIVNRTVCEFDRADHLHGWVEVERNRSNGLRQSILKSAFSGLLIDQDSNDEHASVLLDRIVAGHNKNTAAPKRGRKKKINA